MTVNELQVGNIIKVFPKPEEIVFLRIKEIHKETIVGEFYKSPGFFLRASFKDLNRVELSQDWLVKAGFELIDNVWRSKNQNVDFTIDQHSKKLSFISRDKIIKLEGFEVKDLHQFQNVYSLLTGVNLDIVYTG